MQLSLAQCYKLSFNAVHVVLAPERRHNTLESRSKLEGAGVVQYW